MHYTYRLLLLLYDIKTALRRLCLTVRHAYAEMSTAAKTVCSSSEFSRQKRSMDDAVEEMEAICSATKADRAEPCHATNEDSTAKRPKTGDAAGKLCRYIPLYVDSNSWIVGEWNSHYCVLALKWIVERSSGKRAPTLILFQRQFLLSSTTVVSAESFPYCPGPLWRL